MLSIHILSQHIDS